MGYALKYFSVKVNGKSRKIKNPDGVTHDDLMMYIECIYDAYTPEGCEHARKFLELDGVKLDWRDLDGWTTVRLANARRETNWKTYCEARGIEYEADQLSVWPDKSYQTGDSLF